MRLTNLTLAVSLALLALPMTVFAQEDTSSEEQSVADTTSTEEGAKKSNLTWNLSLTSDYVFRGVSQTNKEPALQGGFDYAFGKSGAYAGVWGSNVDFNDGDGPDLEIDAYIGWNYDLNDKWNLDWMLTRYSYIGERDPYGDVDYNELVGKLKYNDMLTFTLGYTNNYVNSGYDSLYYNLGGNWDLGHEVKLNAGVGYTDLDQIDGYFDWSLGISRKFGAVEAALNYFDTDVDGSHLSDSLVLSFKIGGNIGGHVHKP